MVDSQQQTPVLWWVKRDFRLSDNPALTRALDTGRRVIALWIFEPSMQKAREYSSFHGQAQLQAAKALRAQLRLGNGELCVVQGEVIEVLNEIFALDPFAHMVSHQEVGGRQTFARDRQVSAWAREKGIAWLEYRQTGVFRALSDRSHRQRYWQAWMSQKLSPRPMTGQCARIVPNSALSRWLAQGSARDLEALAREHRSTNTQRVGEVYALRTLDSFLHDRSARYAASISSPALGAIFGSRLSPHLAWGTLSPRTLVRALRARLCDLAPDEPGSQGWHRSLEMFRSRIHWRDHFMQRLESAPDLESKALCPSFEAMFESAAPEQLAAWTGAETGFPLVDACIRAAQHQGFLNFRMRAMITSTACHLLRIPWQSVGWEMAKWWTDYEPGIHWAQIQMQSGMTGINANRIYDPQTQLRRLDPDATFVKRWIPELRSLPAAAILEHHKVPLPGYPAPRVRWIQAREAWKQDYARIAGQVRTKAEQQAVLLRHGSRKMGRIQT